MPPPTLTEIETPVTRLRDARARGCELAMIAASVGSQSQRNAERNGFRIAYTRTKWSRPLR